MLLTSSQIKIVWTEMELFLYLGQMHLMFIMCMLGCYVAATFSKPFAACWKHTVDSCIKVKIPLSVAQPILAEFGGRCWKAIAMLGLGVWVQPSRFTFYFVTDTCCQMQNGSTHSCACVTFNKFLNANQIIICLENWCESIFTLILIEKAHDAPLLLGHL